MVFAKLNVQAFLRSPFLPLTAMHKKIWAILIFISVLLIVSAPVNTNAQTSNPLFTDENIVIGSLVTIHAAQMTYGAVYGNGNYATTLEALRRAELIDPILASNNVPTSDVKDCPSGQTKCDYAPHKTQCCLAGERCIANVGCRCFNLKNGNKCF